MPQYDLISLLNVAATNGASEVHLTVEAPPMMRVNGTLDPLAEGALQADEIRSLLTSVLSDTQVERLEEEWELDFGLQVADLGRFRANAHYSRGAIEATFRLIPAEPPELSTLGHWPSVEEICRLQRGMVLVTGITGSGKSTTTAAMLRRISETRSGVIVTVEEPIEYIFRNAGCLVKQREVGADTKSFASALKFAMRQDPDIIFVGEMRDPETIRAAVTAAETGHLVLATLHTIDAPSSVSRIVDSFPAEQQPQVISQLANSLEAVISQRLLPRADVEGRVMATELMRANSAIRACIRDGRPEQIPGLMEIGGREGMHTIDESLAALIAQGAITKDTAIAHARDRGRFQ